VGINKRVSLRNFVDDISRWVEEGRTDECIASSLGTSPSSVQSFRSRNAIYRRGVTSALHDPKDFSFFEGVLDPDGPGVWFDPEVGNDPRWLKRWKSTERVELSLTPTRIVFLRLEEFNRCSRSPGNPYVEELQTIAHEGGIFLTAVRLGAYSEVGYLVPSFRVRTLGF